MALFCTFHIHPLLSGEHFDMTPIYIELQKMALVIQQLNKEIQLLIARMQALEPPILKASTDKNAIADYSMQLKAYQSQLNELNQQLQSLQTKLDEEVAAYKALDKEYLSKNRSASKGNGVDNSRDPRSKP